MFQYLYLTWQMEVLSWICFKRSKELNLNLRFKRNLYIIRNGNDTFLIQYH